ELMRRAIAAGERTTAIHWYAQLRVALAQALGMRPNGETEALYASCIAELRVEEPGFVGREDELARALAALRGGPEREPVAVLVRGPAGIGKTAFCQRLVQAARADGWGALLLTPSDPQAVYSVVTAAIEQLTTRDRALLDAVGDHPRRVLAALSPIARPAPALPGALARHQVVGALHALLVALRPGAPVLLAVDDAEAIDDASADVLLHLVSTGAPVRVVLALRSTSPQPTLDRSVARVMRASRMLALDLPPLAVADIATLVARAAPRKLDERRLHALTNAAEGNPFVALELARAPGFTRQDSEALPASALEAIAQRFAGVDPSTALALQPLSLAPAAFDALTAAALIGADEAFVFGVLDRALGADIVRVEDGLYRFRHALLRQALADQLPPHRRLIVHREAAQRLEALHAPASLIAHHWCEGGRPDRALAFQLIAAREAAQVAAYAMVLRSVDALLAHEPAHADALRLRAEALDAMGDPRTLPAYDAAIATADAATAHDLRAARALAQIKMSDPRGALESLVGVKPTSPMGKLAEALTYSGAAALGFGDPAVGTAKAAECRRLALRAGDTGALAIASWAQAAAAHARGDLHGSVWADLWETHHVPHLAVRVFDGHLCITQRFLYGARPYSQVIGFADALAAEATRIGAARGRAFAITLRGEAKLLSGQLDAADEDLREGARLHRAIGGATGEALSLQRRAELCFVRGRHAEARALLEAALDLARHCDIGFHLLDRIYGTRIVLATDPDAALAELQEAEEAVRGPFETCPGCRITFAVPAAVAAARVGQLDLAADWERKTEWLAQVVMRLPAWYAAHEEVRGHVARAAGDAGSATSAFARAADAFQRAEHPIDAHRCRELARAS
ncbi:MAG TPA: AAA family ATPase, partial [Polyangiales bacterium]|nr:AAA family ATPase [Polyangiales bacterium]